jgi:cytochrome c-type biogenesis protein CcmI
MALQLIPIIKAVAPYVAQIAAVAIPAFTSKKDTDNADVAAKEEIVAKQIKELQAAASQNAQSVQLLAENLQKAIQSVDTAASEAEKKITLYRRLVVFSFGFSVVSLGLCLYLVLG